MIEEANIGGNSTGINKLLHFKDIVCIYFGLEQSTKMYIIFCLLFLWKCTLCYEF